MTENITPEFLAKMHAALRGGKYNTAPKHLHKKKPSLANPSIGSFLASPPPPLPGGPASGGVTAAAKPIDTPLADSVAQTTAEAAADMADASKAQAAPAKESKAEDAKGTSDDLMHTVLEAEIEEVESSLLNPLLTKVAPPPIENGMLEIKDTQDKIIQRTPYVDGKIKGEVQFFDAQGTMIQTYQCVDGIKQGSMRFFDALGVLTHEVPYVNDKREGMGTFYVNGIKTAEITFHEDNMEGPAIYYASDGYVSAAALYHNNFLHGEMRCFDAQQRLVKSFAYVKGQLSGESVTYYPGGTKVFERMTYAENVPVDKQVQFYEDGGVLSIRDYDKGKLVKEKFYNTKGKEISKAEGEKITNLFPHIPNWKKV